MSKFVYLVSSTCPKGKDFGVVRVFSCYKAALKFCLSLHEEFPTISYKIFEVCVCSLKSDFSDNIFNPEMIGYGEFS